MQMSWWPEEPVLHIYVNNVFLKSSAVTPILSHEISYVIWVLLLSHNIVNSGTPLVFVYAITYSQQCVYVDHTMCLTALDALFCTILHYSALQIEWMLACLLLHVIVYCFKTLQNNISTLKNATKRQIYKRCTKTPNDIRTCSSCRA